MTAADVPDDLRTRLSDVDRVFGAAAETAAEHLDVSGSMVGLRDAVSYPNGAAGALAFLATDPGTLARVGPSYSAFIKRELAGALRDEGLAPDRALLAVHAVRASLPHESWASTLLAVETSLAGRTASLAETIRERLAAGRSPVFHEFDMLLGLGQGALGLDVAQDPARAVEVAGALADLLAASPLPGGVQVDGPPFTGGDWTGEHVNFGLAHGGAGVLHALCSVAFRLRPDQRTPLSVDVAEAAVAALRSRADAIPPFAGWSGTSWSDEPAQYRPSWCYGIVGHALVFAMASLALDRPEHLRHAVELLHEAFRRIDSFEDHSLCHGTAGLVAAGVVVGALDDELGATLGPAVSGLADRMATDHDSSTAFGFSYTSRGFAEAVPVPGVLNGTAGIGLALVLARGGLPRASAIDALLRMSPWTSAPAVRAARWSHS